MQIKKNPKISLEKRRGMHIQIGLVVSLSIVLISMEWTTLEPETAEAVVVDIGNNIEVDVVKVIPRENKPKPKPVLPTVLIPVEAEELDEDVMIDIGEYERDYKQDVWVFDVDEDEDEVIEEPRHRDQVEVRAEFPGGDDALMKWIYANIKYPKECVEHGIEGKVIIQFTISKFGKVHNVQIVRSAHALLDEEVLRVMETIPDFSPAMQNLQLVPVFMYWPIIFKLQ